MSWHKTSGVSIAGIASAVPENVITAEGYAERFGEDVVNKFVKSTGITAAFQSIPEQTTSDLGYEAANYLLNKLRIDRSRIGVLVFASNTADYMFPATAGVIQSRLGLSMDVTAFDIRLGCTAFVYGQHVVESLMMTSGAEYGLLVCGDTTSKVIGENDHSVMMFGDAASAVLFGRQEGLEQITLLGTDGNRFGSLIFPAGGFRDREASREKVLCSDGVLRSKYEQYMDGMGVMIFAVGDVMNAMVEYLDAMGKSASDYDKVVLHQANGFILNRLIKKMKLEPDKVPISLSRYGNTSGASIPLTLCDCYGAVENGSRSILASGFGVGLSWGVTSFDIDTASILPIIHTDKYFKEGRIDLSQL
ncbi:3-oxoacyl-ACP synthase III family protein [Adlercreutzia sp. ZJ138]|uniref:3-oxoacyl-ACP synthase III family protein n=1 Tax=Adlercreutzia sp. ZJ138 TaxID=2709405 RepID=UPI0013EAA69C|nr:ketoacyl-ACP synthase III [Adlercreutzia sp. ZJ138]